MFFDRFHAQLRHHRSNVDQMYFDVLMLALNLFYASKLPGPGSALGFLLQHNINQAFMLI